MMSHIITLTGWLAGWAAASHAVHHRTGAAPYGFLCPVMRARALTERREDPLRIRAKLGE
jgi:hypothetical protein